YRNIRRSF
ncbi:putative membrane protein, partial [Vibrio parahaemolyticus V-223/04]